MKFKGSRVKLCMGVLCAACLIPAGGLLAQAPAGPLPPSHPLPPPPPPPPAKKKVEVQPRKTFAGFWTLNREESDDPRQRFEDARTTKAGPQGGNPSGNPTGGIGGPHIGIGGYPYPGGGPTGPYGGGGGSQGDTSYESPELLELIRAVTTQDISLKENEVDSTDEHFNRLVFYTDGRKVQKSTDDSRQEVSARWNGPQLVTDEKGPKNRKISRTLELSPDGKQMYETWHIEGRRSDREVTVRYVYDAAIDDHR